MEEHDLVKAIEEATERLDEGQAAEPASESVLGDKPATPPAPDPAPPAPTPAPDPKPKAEEEADADLPPETADPNRENFRALREKAKALKQRVRELEQGQVRQPGEPTADAPRPAPEPAPAADPAQQMDLDQVLDTLGKSRAGDMGEQSARLADLAQRALEEFSPADLARALDRARKGGFGRNSEDLADVIKDALPVVTAVWQERRSEKERQEQLVRQAMQSQDRARSLYPDLAKADSPMQREYLATLNELVGEFDAQGRLVKAGKFPQLVHRTDLPEILAEFASLRLNAREAETLRAAAKERDELRAKLQRITSPESVRRSAQAAGRPDPAEAELDELRDVIRRESALLRG